MENTWFYHCIFHPMPIGLYWNHLVSLFPLSTSTSYNSIIQKSIVACASRSCRTENFLGSSSSMASLNQHWLNSSDSSHSGTSIDSSTIQDTIHIPMNYGHDHRTSDFPCICHSMWRMDNVLELDGFHLQCSAPCSSLSRWIDFWNRCHAGTDNRGCQVSDVSCPSCSSIYWSWFSHRSMKHHQVWTHDRSPSLLNSSCWLSYCHNPSVHSACSVRMSDCTMFV